MTYRFFPDEHFVDDLFEGVGPEQDAHRKRNFDLCRAVDMTSLSIALDALVAAGMPKRLAELHHDQIAAALALLRSENNRLLIARRP